MMTGVDKDTGNGLTRLLILKVAGASIGIITAFCATFGMWTVSKFDDQNNGRVVNAERIAKLESTCESITIRVTDTKLEFGTKLNEIRDTVKEIDKKINEYMREGSKSK
jgi:hypothetical protein